eukprot:260500_1
MNNEQLISKLESSILWTNLKSKDDPDLQIQTASQFRDILLSGCTTVSEYNYVLSSILDEKIKTCVFSTLPHEIIGGILLISELILYIICKFEELLEFFSRYGTYLTEILLKCNSHGSISVVALCCTTLGQLVPLSHNYSRRIVESHISQCIKWISTSYNKQTCCEQHKIAGVWLLCEYAQTVPILFNVHINEIIVTIVSGIRDKSETVRIGSCRVLNECLQLISKRPHREQTSLSSRIVTDGYQGLLNYHSSNVGVKHGSLLTFQCVLNYCIKNKVIISTIDFDKLCKLTLAEKDNRKPMIKLSVIKLLPLFAQYQTNKFINNFLDQSLSYLIQTLKDTNSRAIHSGSKEYIKNFRNESFKSIGKISIIVGTKMIRSKKSELDQRKALKTLGRMLSATKNQSQLTKIIKIINESFILAKNRKKENKPYEKYIKYPLKCLLMLSNALNNEISLFFNNEKNIIQNIFDLGLSKSILKCIQNIYQNVYSYQPLIQDKLSRMVWMLLLYNINPPKHQQNNGINHSDEESKHQQNNDHHHNIHDHSDGNEDNIHDIHTNDIMDINMNINHNMHMHMNINHNIDDDDEYNKNIMYYHYKYNTTTFNIQRQQCITNNQYINKYNTNEEIPPFVSPPIINIKTQIKSHGGPSINPVLGPRKPSDYTDYNNEYSHGSLNNLHSPHNVVYNMSEQQRRRNSSVHHNDNNHQNQDINLNITEFQDKELRNPKLIQLALETMSKFNLHDVNINLLHFVRETVLFYCNHTNINIRKQAGITCCILLSRIIQQMEKEKDHLKLHWIEMNNTHSIKPQIIEQNNSIPTPSNINNIYGDKSVTTTPQNQPFYTSPLWAMSYPSLPFVDPPNTTNTNTNNDNMNMNNNMSLHIPTNMYINDNILSEIKDDDEIIITSSYNNNNNNNNEYDNNKCDGLHMQLSGQHQHESSIIMHILAKLLSLAIADVEIEVREQLLLSLLENKLFYTYLSQQQLLPSLFIALNDEYFGVREIALKLLGILATYNPAHIMPFIRKNLLELLTYLDNRTLLSIEQQKEDINHRQQTAELIGDLIESASTETMKPYVNRIMIVLLRQLKLGDNIFVEISILRTIGKLAKVAQQSLIQYFNRFLPILVSTLSKTSESIKSSNINKLQSVALINKKCVALQTLGQVIESTGLVIQPYLLYKKLLKIILDSLKSDQHLTIRREAIQVLGIIGALDPHIHKQNLKQIEIQEKLEKKLNRNKNKIANLISKNKIKITLNTDNINEDEFYDEEES